MRRYGFHASAWKDEFQADRGELCLCGSRKRKVGRALPVMLMARARSPQKRKISTENALDGTLLCSLSSLRLPSLTSLSSSWAVCLLLRAAAGALATT